jgi:SRSO17 transposase
MELRYKIRKREIEKDAEIDPDQLAGALTRMANFIRPYAETIGRKEMQRHCLVAVKGMLSDLRRKNTESIAYRHGNHRRALQRFIGNATWGVAPLIDRLSRQVGETIGETDGVIVFDPSAFKKCGNKSVGVARQWLGRFGKIDNGQVGVFMAYASRREHALVNTRLFLPKEWADDPCRCRKAGVPEEQIEHRTRCELCLEMLDQSGDMLPHRWIAGDDELGRPSWFRRTLRDRGEKYVLAVPSNTSIRDLENVPEYSGQGRPPKGSFQTASAWSESLTADAWTTVTVRDGEKGPLTMKIAVRRVLAKTERDAGTYDEELLIVTERRDGDGVRRDYHVSNAETDESLDELSRVIVAEHRVEDCLRRAKSDAGLADYECRTWPGWHHHIVLSMLAIWFLTVETLSGKKIAVHAYAADGLLYTRNIPA